MRNPWEHFWRLFYPLSPTLGVRQVDAALSSVGTLPNTLFLRNVCEKIWMTYSLWLTFEPDPLWMKSITQFPPSPDFSPQLSEFQSFSELLTLLPSLEKENALREKRWIKKCSKDEETVAIKLIPLLGELLACRMDQISPAWDAAFALHRELAKAFLASSEASTPINGRRLTQTRRNLERFFTKTDSGPLRRKAATALVSPMDRRKLTK